MDIEKIIKILSKNQRTFIFASVIQFPLVYSLLYASVPQFPVYELIDRIIFALTGTICVTALSALCASFYLLPRASGEVFPLAFIIAPGIAVTSYAFILVIKSHAVTPVTVLMSYLIAIFLLLIFIVVSNCIYYWSSRKHKKSNDTPKPE